ncbi:FecR family protein [Larkinella rosea]|uniref:DUF4974 domain-containing protein n=1 Tax=Larkinella rosea TaxID=2025312 RepID=A0A3P1C1Y1_9BACT|nr:FecR domain-containing protein [Larkinella rosea]RRB07249.1 DUF4974 domain-containing protein [Larkinella rosea]
MDYQDFTTSDFVKDASFQRWVIAPDAATNSFWETWLQNHPNKASELEEARQLILDLKFGQNYNANRAMVEVWQNLQAEIAAEERTETAPVKRASRVLPENAWRAAAVFTGIFILSYFLFQLYRPEPTTVIATRFGETKTVTLPDQSIVTLNANTRLTFPTHWDPEKTREVWLDGEAFFNIRQKPASGQALFRVHSNAVDVEVLGTTFNVNNRHARSRVVLATGKVRLTIPRTDRQKPILMQPGDLVEVPENGSSIIQAVVDPDSYSSWRNNRLIFDKTPLRDIATLLEDTYGYTITFTKPQLAVKKFSGSVPARQPELLLTTLTRLYGLSITRNNRQLTISN